MLYPATDKIRKTNLWKLLLLSIAASELLSAGVVSIVRLILRARISYDDIVTSAITSAIVTASVLVYLMKQFRAAKEQLLKNEEKYRFISENIADIVWTLDLNFQTEYVSPSIEQILGFTPEERKLQTLQEMITPASAEKARALLLEMLQQDKERHADPQQSIKIEIEYYHKNGSTVWMENSVKAIRDAAGEIVGMHGVSHDVTERKRIEGALRESESKFRELFEFSPQAIALTESKTGKLVDVNRKFCELTKFGKKEIIGKTTTEIGFYSEYNRKRFLSEIQTAGEVNGLEMDFKAKDGAILNSVMFARVIQRGSHSYILTMFHDVTEKKQLERQLLQVQRIEALGTLAGGIAHDFNNILAAIVGYTELARMKVGSPDGCRELDQVLKAAERAGALVKQILTYSRQGEQKLRPTPLQPIVKEALKMLRSTIPATIEFRENVTECGAVLVDATQIHQVIMNLCTNAYHAMEQQGGALEITLTEVHVEGSGAALNTDLPASIYAKLSVSDTGTGIEPANLDRIFDPYFTTKESGKGTGLGLSVVHGIVKGHNGAIRVYSTYGKGTTFDVYLPVIQHQEELKTSEISAFTGDEAILFIDDEAPIAEVQKELLERLGYRVTIQTSSLEALEMLKSDPGRFDLIICDTTMPQLTGDMLASEILKIKPEIPIILCTGHSGRIDAQKAARLGVRHLLFKPVPIDEMAFTIRKALSKG